MARAALEWSLDRLAHAAEVNKRTVMRHEAGEAIRPENVEALRAAFVAKGIAFTNGGKRAGVTYSLTG
jgi:predicted transcriptional regulator